MRASIALAALLTPGVAEAQDSPICTDLSNATRILICGFGRLAESAARTLLRRGQGCAICVLEYDDMRGAAALSLGLRLICSPIQEALRRGGFKSVSRIIVDTGDDLETCSIITAARAAFRNTHVAAAVTAPETADLALASGADQVVCEAQVAGLLLAASACRSISREVHH